MKSIALSLLLSFASAACAQSGIVIAQRDLSSAAARSLFTDTAPFCSTGLQVQRRAGGALFDAAQSRSGTRLSGAATDPLVARYHLATPDNKVLAMQITAHGFSRRNRVVLLDGSVHPDIATKLDISFAAQDDHSVASDIALAHFAGLTSIDVESIAYADGTTWHATHDRPCTVYPDLLLPVSAR